MLNIKVFLAAFCMLTSLAAVSQALPPTTNTGPGGFEATDAASNLRLWLRADAGVTGTTNVTAWSDQSFSGFNLTATSGPALISSVSSLNNQSTLRFNGSSSTLTEATSGIYNSAQSTTFVVAQKPDLDGAARYILDTSESISTRYTWVYAPTGTNAGWNVTAPTPRINNSTRPIHALAAE